MTDSEIKLVSSSENTRFKALKKLLTSARERRKSNQAVIEGFHLLDACAEANLKPESVFLGEQVYQSQEARKLFKRLAPRAITLLAENLLSAVSDVETPSGILAVLDIPGFRPPKNPSLVLFLEDIQDPGNLGSILRTAAGAGVDVAYLSKGCADPWSPKVLRSGMGAHFRLPIVEHGNLPELAREFRGLVVATSLHAEKSLFDLDLAGPVAFVFGNEGAGLSSELAACAHVSSIIPMPGEIESLNVGAAVAVCLFEKVRQGLTVPSHP